jgi:hypothetical protein
MALPRRENYTYGANLLAQLGLTEHNAGRVNQL